MHTNKKYVLLLVVLMIVILISCSYFFFIFRKAHPTKEEGGKSLTGNVPITGNNEIIIPANSDTVLVDSGQNTLSGQNPNPFIDRPQRKEPKIPEETPNLIVETAKEDFEREYISQEVINKLGKEKEVRILVKLKDIQKSNEVMKEIGFKRKTGNFISGTVDEAKMVDFLTKFSSDDIEGLQIDHEVKPMEEQISRTSDLVNMDELESTGISGKGQTICMIDSGIDYSHPDLTDNYIGGYDFVNNDNDPMDDEGHGTRMAGIITGLAKDSKILAVKAFNNNGIGYESDLIAAIDYCIQQKQPYNISIMLMSFGGGSYNTSCYCDENPVTSEANHAASEGIFAVAASGNYGGNYLMAPACGTNVTSVGAVYSNDKVISWTNIEPLLDLLAFGVKIETTNLGGGYAPVGGTSVSAAYAAGAAALLLEKETLSPLDLQHRLRSTGALIAYGGHEYQRVDVVAALNNRITNSPSEQQGDECAGSWISYELLAGFTCSMVFNPSCSPDCDCCDNGADNFYCTGNSCEIGVGCHNDGTCSCNIAECGSFSGSPKCDTDADCGAGVAGSCDTSAFCLCNFLANCSNSARGCFKIQNRSAYFQIDKNGWMDVLGKIYANNATFSNACKCNATCLFIKNSTGACVAIFGYPYKSDLTLRGNVMTYNSNCSNISGTGLIILNSTGGPVAKINSNGTLCLKKTYMNYSGMY